MRGHQHIYRGTGISTSKYFMLWTLHSTSLPSCTLSIPPFTLYCNLNACAVTLVIFGHFTYLLTFSSPSQIQNVPLRGSNETAWLFRPASHTRLASADATAEHYSSAHNSRHFPTVQSSRQVSGNTRLQDTASETWRVAYCIGGSWSICFVNTLTLK